MQLSVKKFTIFRIFQLFLILNFSFLIISSCSSNKDLVRLIEKNFDEEVATTGNLIFTFDQDLVPDSLVGYWEKDQYINFSPEIKGRFKWTAPNTLIFSPAKALSPATEYSAKITEKVLKHTKKLTLDGDLEFQFHTPLLLMNATNVYWASLSDDNPTGFVHFDVNFNYDVKPEQVAELIQVEIDGQAQDFTLKSNKNSQTVSIYVPGIKAEDKDFKSKISIKKGLKAANGTLEINEDYSEDLTIPSPFKLIVESIASEHDGSEGVATVQTSQEVKAKNIKNYIEISPSISYNVEIDERSFRLTSSEFSVETKYEIKIKKGLEGKIGGKLKFDYEQELSFGKLNPSIKFANKRATYLTSKGNKQIEVNITSVPNVNVKITKVYENNILSYLANYRTYNYDYEEDYYDDYYYDDYYGNNNQGNLGDVIYEEEIETKTLQRFRSNRVLKMDFKDKIKNYSGLYVIEVASKNDYWLKDKIVISISDIGIISKASPKSITVFTNSIQSAKPLSGVKMNFIGRNNQIVGSATTDENGIANYDLPQDMPDGFSLKMVTAQMGEDFNYLPFDRTQINSRDFNIGGKSPNASGFDAYIYGERAMYRPGETIHLSTILRDDEWNTPQPMPMKLKLISPNGKTYKTVRKTLNKHGSFEASIDLSTAAMTGRYTAQVYSANDVLMNSKSIMVEEFMPDRIKVKLDLDKEDAKTGDEIKASVLATNFFGPPAANRNYEIEMSLRRMYFSPKKYRNYNFSLQRTNNYFAKDLRENKTDEAGKAEQSFRIANKYSNIGKLQADFFTTVFDETGRPVSRRKTLDVYTQDVFYGIKYTDYYNRTGRTKTIPLIAVDKDGKALTGIRAKVKLIKHEYKTVLSRSGSYFRYRSEKVEKVIINKTMIINDENTVLSFTPERSGKYELQVSKPGVSSYVNMYFYTYGWGNTGNNDFKVNPDGEIDIELDKEKYEVGETANVLIKTPFTGRMLITVEGDKVVKHFYRDLTTRSDNFELPITDDFVPNVYISATLFRPHKNYDLPLTVAHGYASVSVENSANIIPLSISAAKSSRSKTKQNIRIKTQPNAAVTLAVVDEGILQLTNYQTPNPYDFFYAKRALQVKSYDVYPYLFPEIKSKSSGGGDGDVNAKRLNPLQNNRVKLVSFWSGILQADASGNVNYEIDIPQFSGDLRIMAVAYKDKAFNGTHTNMKVADPLVISTALPRFLSPRDTVLVPVILTNTTKNNSQAKAKLSVSGPVEILGGSSKSVNLNANSENELLYTLVCKPEIGEAKISVSVDALNETFLNETDITIRPASPLQKTSGSGVVVAGKSNNFNMDVGGFIPQSVDNKLVISKSPVVQFADDLDYLIRYPYGCVEQTTSAAFPQLYIQDIVKDIYKGDVSNRNPNFNVQQAIKRLQLMQLYNGGLTYWPGHGYESWWGSAYAAHFIIEAEKAGFEIDKSFKKKLLGYLKTKLKQRNTVMYYYNGSMRRRIAPRTVAYSLYVLALAGKPHLSTMNYYKARPNELSLDSKYLLAAAYFMAGDKKKYQQVLPPEFKGEKANQSFGGSFYSYVRDEAIALNALIEVDPDNSQIGIMAKHVSEHLKNRRYLNTQERAFSFLALGKLARKANAADIQATIKCNGKEVGKFDNKTMTLNTADLKGTKIEISASGKGNLYYFWEAEGISSDGSYREVDNFLRVRKAFFDRNGRQITNNQFQQNDLVVVRLTIQCSNDKYVENVALTDILPAGFEIENPRISELPNVNWASNRSRPAYMDVRDDRINYFMNVNRNIQYFYYVVRAVSPGTFQMGPVGADAMYNGEYHSYNGGGTITVSRKTYGL